MSEPKGLPQGLSAMLRYRGFGGEKVLWQGCYIDETDECFQSLEDIKLSKSLVSHGLEEAHMARRIMTRREATRRFCRQHRALSLRRNLEGFDPGSDRVYLGFKERVWTEPVPDHVYRPEKLLICFNRKGSEKKPGIAPIKALLAFAAKYHYNKIILVTDNGVTNPAKDLCGSSPSSKPKDPESKDEDEDEDPKDKGKEEEEEEEEVLPKKKVLEEEETEEEEEALPEEEEVQRAAKVELLEYKDVQFDLTENFWFPSLRILGRQEVLDGLGALLVDFHLQGSQDGDKQSRTPVADPKKLLARAWQELERLLPGDSVSKMFCLEEGEIVELEENVGASFEVRRNLRVVRENRS